MTGLAWDDGDVPLLRWTSAPPSVEVGFTSRNGGRVEGPYRSLNLGALTADQAANVAENRRRAVSSRRRRRRRRDDGVAGARGRGARGGRASPRRGRFLEPGVEAFPKSDGLVTGLPARPLVLLTADCLPVAVARADGRRLAVLHAGWRGLVAGIVERGVEAVGGRATAAVGPGAGPCCYEVGDDVAGVLRERFGDDVVRDGKADLWLARAASARERGGCRRRGGRRVQRSAGPSGTSRTVATMATTGRQGIVGVLRG